MSGRRGNSAGPAAGRRRWLVRLALALSIVGGPRAALALAPGKPLTACSIDVWRGREGLPGNWVRQIRQTPDGYLWIATNGGLARYDGARIVAVGPLVSGDIMGFAASPPAELWVLPSYEGPDCPRGDGLVPCLPEGQRFPKGTRLTAALLEADGSAWMAGRKELHRFEHGRRVRVAPLAQLGFQAVHRFLRDRGGRLWVATDRGLFFAQDGGWVLHAASSAALGGAVTALFESPAGGLWAVSKQALARIDGDQTTAFTAGFPGGNISDVIEDRDGNVWIASGEGLSRFRDGRFTTFTTADGLPDENVTALLEDREGSLWVGSRSGGLAQLSDRTVDTHSGPPVLRTRWVDTVAEDASGTLWFGWLNGLVRWRDGEERTYSKADGLPGDRVEAVLPGANGELWIGTERGLGRLRPAKAGGGDVIDAIPGIQDHIYSLHLDETGALWAGADGHVLRVRDGQLDRRFAGDGLGGQVRGLAQDDQGKLWAASIQNIGRLEGERFERAPPLVQGLATTSRSLHRDPRGTLWIGTEAGLLSYARGRYHLLRPFELPAAPQIYQIISDDLGYLWMGTNRGVARVAAAALEASADGGPAPPTVVFGTSDRRRDASVAIGRQPGAWKGRDGRLWFASDDGVVTIDPRTVEVNALAPNVVIEEALLDGRLARPGQPGVFPPGPGTLEVRFSAITLLEPHKARHRYRLEGFDDRWVEAGGRRVAYYTNLPAGRYHFRVQGSNGDGVWSEARVPLDLVLRPHFYRTIWFYGLCVAAALALGVLLYRRRLAHLRQAYLAAFAERSRVARELHDTLLQGMAAIGMQLRSLRRRLEPSAPAAARELGTLEDMVTLGLDETRRVLWNLRETPVGNGDLSVALGSLAERLAQGRPVVCAVQIDGAAVALPNGVQGEIFRIAQEAIANAVKHANASHIEVRLCYEAEHVKLVVSDDGRGFEPAEESGAAGGHFGLVGMRERAARLGTLVIASQPGEGTRVELVVPSGGPQAVEHADA